MQDLAALESEPHYRISELAARWKLGRETLRKLFQNEPGVVKIRLGKKKTNTTYTIPLSVAQRTHSAAEPGLSGPYYKI
jgi:hypothetical protein